MYTQRIARVILRQLSYMHINIFKELEIYGYECLEEIFLTFTKPEHVITCEISDKRERTRITRLSSCETIVRSFDDNTDYTTFQLARKLAFVTISDENVSKRVDLLR